MKKKIDLSIFEKKADDNIIRRVLFGDENLQILLCLIYEEDAITLPNLKRKYNKMRATVFERYWFYQKLEKIKHFDLYDKKTFGDCKEDGVPIERTIIKKHKEYILGLEPYQYKSQEGNTYYFLTGEGLKWIDWICEHIQKRKKGG